MTRVSSRRLLPRTGQLYDLPRFDPNKKKWVNMNLALLATFLDEELGGGIGHTHTMGQVAGLVDLLNSKADLTGTIANADAVGGKNLAALQVDINTSINAKIEDITNGAPEAYNTFLELYDLITNNPEIGDAFAAALAVRIKYSDIINDVVTDLADRPLSAAMGKYLKAQFDFLNTNKANAYQVAAIESALSFKLSSTGTAYDSARLAGYTFEEIQTLWLNAVATNVNALINGAPGTFDTLKEIADYIAADQTGMAAVLAAVAQRVQYSDIVNNLESNAADKPLSAYMGKYLLSQINAEVVRTTGNQVAEGVKTFTNGIISHRPMGADITGNYLLKPDDAGKCFWVKNGSVITIPAGNAETEIDFFVSTSEAVSFVNGEGVTLYSKSDYRKPDGPNVFIGIKYLTNTAVAIAGALKA